VSTKGNLAKRAREKSPFSGRTRKQQQWQMSRTSPLFLKALAIARQRTAAMQRGEQIVLVSDLSCHARKAISQTMRNDKTCKAAKRVCVDSREV
jgi:hypothetical protein